MSDGTSNTQTTRIWSLDSLRGLAACAVVFHHGLWLLYQFSNQTHTGWIVPALIWSPLHIFWAGDEAVIIFFVLSGYVLSDKFWSGRQQSYIAFVFSRFARLYPAYIATVLIVAGISAAIIHLGGLEAARWCSHMPWHLSYCGMSDWRPLTVAEAVRIVTMYVSRYSWIDPVLWTLVVEIQVSIIFPVLITLMRLFGWFSIPAAIAGHLVTKALFLILPPPFATALGPVFASLGYVWYFVVGAELCRRKMLIDRMSARLLPWQQWAILTVGLISLLTAWLFWFLPPVLIPLFWGVGAAIIIGSVRHGRSVRKALEIPALRWTGERAYSLYLVHYPILAMLVMLAWPRILVWTLPALLLPVSLFASYWMYRYVERPGIDLGKKLISAWKL